MILFFMLCGRTPFEGENLNEIYRKISHGDFILPRTLTADAGDLIRGMLTVTRSTRFTRGEIRQHPWINDGYDKLVSNYLPERPAVVLNPSESTLNKMSVYGFNIDEVAEVLAKGDSTPNPMVTIYHLVEESRGRKEPKDCAQAATASAANTVVHPQQPGLSAGWERRRY